MSYKRAVQLCTCLMLMSVLLGKARGEAMLSLFNLTWNQVSQKMPEIAEAGYDSLWLPPPAKAGSGYSVGYDCFDVFDLGDKNQRGTIPTRYGTKAELLQMVEMAHRFGIRVYFDNISNHRGFDTPGFNAGTPTNLYPGLLPQDFHLQTVAGGHYANWPGIESFNNQFDVQYEPLSGLIDLATEPGSVNGNFGPTLGSTIPKISFIRQPNNPDYYMDTNGVSLGGPWHPFNGNGQPVSEDVNAYLIRAVMWTLYQTKCDGFRLDAVKHVPSGFFGDSSTSWNGYTGGIQAMFDYVHGYGANVTGNGYVESDDSRNSCFDSEAPRNDALLFGEHLGAPPTFSEYLSRGMRLLNVPLANQLNSALGNPGSGLNGMDGRDYRPFADAFTGPQSVMFAQSHDNGYAAHRDLQNAYYFTHEGIPEIYSDGYNQSQAPQGQNPFPAVANANYLGEFGDNAMPELAYLHNQMSRGGTWSRWSDSDTVVFERYDYREGSGSSPQYQDVLLFAMNDNYGFPGDISFDDGVAQAGDGYYGCFPVSNSRGVGVVVGFPPGSVLVQMAKSSAGANRACPKLLVHPATQSLAAAQASANDTNALNRLIYVGGQTLAPGGGAVELLIPSGGYVMYGYQWPEASRASQKDAITLQQGGVDARRLTMYRQDGTNGDAGFNPLYPFKMRGSVDQYGNTVTGANVSNLTYAVDVPIVTNAAFDIILRNDASSGNAMIKLDGGVDINSQMGLGATNGTDLRDNKPGYATDVFLGYEQAALQFQNGPEKFVARNILSNNLVSLGAETYYYTVGGANTVVPGAGYGAGITNQTANWAFHDPTNGVTAVGTVPPTQLNPLNPAAGQSAEVWVKVGYQFQVNRCFIYFTTDGTNPEGSFGAGRGTTQVVQALFASHDSGTSSIDWWQGTLPAQTNGTPVRYKVAVFSTGIQPISDAEASGSKLYGLTQYAITNFNPTTARVWLHNDLSTNNTTTGLREGFHIVRARTFLPRAGKASVYNTFLQTFYYDAQLPSGTIAYPAADGATVSNNGYTMVVRADGATTGVEYNISDSNAGNDDVATGQSNGNGLSNGVPVFAQAQLVSPDPTLDQQYPSQPREYRFSYVGVPNTGTATITVRLKKLTTSVYTNRLTTLTRTINTVAPTQIVHISAPASDGQVLYLKTNDVYTIQTCFSQSLYTNDITLFSIYINGVFQPRQATNGSPLYFILSPTCGSGFMTLGYHWTGASPGTNTIQVTVTKNPSLTDARTVRVVNPIFNITSFVPAPSGGSIVWDSAPSVNYQVWATTNLVIPMAPISTVIPASGTSTFFFDPAPDTLNKFYRIQLLP